MSVNRLLNAIETEFKTALNTAKTCEQFPGPFTVQTIVDQSFTAPAAFVGCNGFQEPRLEDERFINTRLAAKLVDSCIIFHTVTNLDTIRIRDIGNAIA